LPYRWRELSAGEYARSVGAQLPERRLVITGIAPRYFVRDFVVLPSRTQTCARLGAEAGADVSAACLRNQVPWRQC